MAKVALLAAGGTGGHLFPALALGEALAARGWEVHFAADARVAGYSSGVPAARMHVVRAATIAGGNPVAFARSLLSMGAGLRDARRLLRRVRPAIAVGFGGYPTVPPLAAARLAGLPTLVHEQNAVLGRANRLLVRLGASLATGFRDPKGVARGRSSTFVGNPVRAAIRQAASAGYAAPEEGERFGLLVFGGSQGARAFSDVVPAAVGRLPEAARQRLDIVQQCRPEDLERTREAYRALGVEATLEPFFADMATRLAAAHLVVSRAGASTVTELAAIGRPAILVPYPHALDHDQAENARALAQAGGAWLFPEPALSPDVLAGKLAGLMANPRALAVAAAAARREARLDAADRLADLVERLAAETSATSRVPGAVA